MSPQSESILSLSDRFTYPDQNENSPCKDETVLRLVLESIGEGVCGVDIEGNNVFINTAGLHLLGYDSAAELLGRSMHKLIHHTSMNGSPCLEEQCRVKRAIREGKNFHVEDELLWRRDGSRLGQTRDRVAGTG